VTKILLSVLSLFLAASLSAQIAPTVITETDAPAFLIPVAGNVPGANQTHFRTNLTIVNYRNVEQLVDVTFLPQTGAPVTTRLAIPFLANLTFPDVVGGKLGTTGLGALRITAVRADGSPDPEAILDGSARIWTPADRGGQISSFVAGMNLGGWRDGSPAYVHGTRRTSQFRTNYGIVNLSSAPRSFRVIVNSGLGRYEETVTVGAQSLLQRPVVEGYGDLSIYVEPLGEGGSWRAYATSTDNESGSTWIVPAMQPRRDIVFP
jgi:hypothetical protein